MKRFVEGEGRFPPVVHRQESQIYPESGWWTEGFGSTSKRNYRPDALPVLPNRISRVYAHQGTPPALKGEQVNHETQWQGRYFQTQVNPQYNANGEFIGCIGVAVDITKRKQAEKALQRSEVLEQLATGASLNEILTALVTNAEKHSAEVLCSVLLLDDDGKHLRHGAAPSLPDFYSEAFDGIEIGSDIGACGCAAYTGERVIVEDIMTHPECAPNRELTGKAGLRACWAAYHRFHWKRPGDLINLLPRTTCTTKTGPGFYSGFCPTGCDSDRASAE